MAEDTLSWGPSLERPNSSRKSFFLLAVPAFKIEIQITLKFKQLKIPRNDSNWAVIWAKAALLFPRYRFYKIGFKPFKEWRASRNEPSKLLCLSCHRVASVTSSLSITNQQENTNRCWRLQIVERHKRFSWARQLCAQTRWMDNISANYMRIHLQGVGYYIKRKKTNKQTKRNIEDNGGYIQVWTIKSAHQRYHHHVVGAAQRKKNIQMCGDCG